MRIFLAFVMVFMLFAPAALRAEQLPSFVDESGTPRTFSEFQGKPVLVNVWATWCAPCVSELPALDRLQQDLGDKIEVVAVSVDTKERATLRQFLIEKNITHLALYKDENGEFLRRLGTQGLPTTLILNAEGKELVRFYGVAEWDSPAVREMLLKSPENIKTVL